MNSQPIRDKFGSDFDRLLTEVVGSALNTDHLSLNHHLTESVSFTCAAESIYENPAFRFSGQSGQKTKASSVPSINGAIP